MHRILVTGSMGLGKSQYLEPTHVRSGVFGYCFQIVSQSLLGNQFQLQRNCVHEIKETTSR